MGDVAKPLAVGVVISRTDGRGASSVLYSCQPGCQSSTRLPSGSVTQPKRPTPSMSGCVQLTADPMIKEMPDDGHCR